MASKNPYEAYCLLLWTQSNKHSGLSSPWKQVDMGALLRVCPQMEP